MALGMGVVAFGQAAGPATKVGIIHIQRAVVQTKDGQKAAADLDARFAPKRKEVESKQNELQQLQAQYNAGANTMSDEAKLKLQREIDQRRKQLQRDVDDAQAELDQAQNRIWQEVGQKVMAVVDRYASEHGFSLILDVSSPQTPVLYASNAINITEEIVALYDKTHSGAAAAPAAAAAAPASAPKPAAAKPAASK